MSVRLTSRPLSAEAAMRKLSGPGLGGVVLFAGRVRADRLGRVRVTALDYEAHRRLALRFLASLERRARARFRAGRVVLWHRLGAVRADEVSVIVGAACAHRTAAFTATRFLVEELKASAPIWKAERAPPARRPRRPRSRPAARSSG